MCDGVELLTSVHCNMNDDVKSKNELHAGERIQDAGDPFVLPRYRVRSVAVGMSKRISVDEGHPTFESGRVGQRQKSPCSKQPRGTRFFCICRARVNRVNSDFIGRGFTRTSVRGNG